MDPSYIGIPTRRIDPPLLPEEETRRLQRLFFDKTKPRAFRQCLVFDCHDTKTVDGHVVPRSWMKEISGEGHVMSFISRRLRQYPDSGDVEAEYLAEVRREPVSTATVRHFTCANHEKFFFDIDKAQPDTSQARILNLMAYRAVLAQLWTELTVRGAHAEVLNQNPTDELAAFLFHHRQQTANGLNYYKRELERCLDPARCRRCHGGNCKTIAHVVRHIRGDPVLASSQFSSGLRTEIIDVGLEHPMANWGLTIVPSNNGHTVVLHYFLEDTGISTLMDQAIRNYRALHGRALEQFISMDIIDYTEGFVLSPSAWERFGPKRRDAIVRRFSSEIPFVGVGTDHQIQKYSAELTTGTRPAPPNPKQLNLFRC